MLRAIRDACLYPIVVVVAALVYCVLWLMFLGEPEEHPAQVRARPELE